MTTKCPACGRPLTELSERDAETAPWLCVPCARGFWSAELSPEARAIYRPQYNDWGFGAQWLRDQVDAERGA